MNLSLWIWGGVMTCGVIMLLYWVWGLYISRNLQIKLNEEQVKFNETTTYGIDQLVKAVLEGTERYQ